MQISNSDVASYSLRGLGKTSASEQPARVREKVTIDQPSSDKAQKQSSAAPRIDADPQAIELFAKQSQSPSSATQGFDTQGSATLDRPPEQNRSALAAYRSVGDQAQRENVQQLFGVDVFA